MKQLLKVFWPVFVIYAIVGVLIWVICGCASTTLNPLVGQSSVIADADGHVARAQDNIHVAQKEKVAATAVPLAVADSELTQAREKLLLAKGGNAAAEKQIAKLQKELADYKDSMLTKVRKVLWLTAAGLAVTALGWLAVAYFTGMIGAVRIAIGFFASAAITACAAYWLKMILIITGIAIVIGAAVYAAFRLFKHQP